MGAEKHYLKFCSRLDWSCKRMMTAGWVQSIHTMRREERDLEVKEEKRIEMAITMGMGDEIQTIPESASNELKPTVPTAAEEGGQQIQATSPLELDSLPKNSASVGSARKDSGVLDHQVDPQQIADFFTAEERRE